MKAKRTEPTKHLLDGAPYTSSHETNIAERFRRIREAQKKADPTPNVTPLPKRRTP